MLLFHGTSASNWSRMQLTCEPLRCPYVTDSRALAEYYGEESAEESGETDYVVICLRISSNDANKVLLADFSAHEDPITYGLPDGIPTTKAFHEALENGELSWPDGPDDHMTSLRNTRSARLSVCVPVRSLSLDVPATLWRPESG